jgi:hypothetical protein
MTTAITTNLCVKPNDIIQAVQKENWQYFLDSQQALEQMDINWAFEYACAIGASTPFIDNILSLQVDTAYIKRGCVEAFKEQYYGTVQHVLQTYGKTLKINILEQIATRNMSDETNFAKFLAQPDTQQLCALILSLAPNHTQRVRHKVKYYYKYDYLTYATFYNMLLQDLLQHLLCFVEGDQIPSKHLEQLQGTFKAIEILAGKKFPLFARNIHSIQMMKLEHLFAGRMRDTQPKSFTFEYDYGNPNCNDLVSIGSHRMLFIKENDAKTHQIMQQIKKHELVKELCYFAHAPQEVTQHVLLFFEKRDHCVIKIPNDIEAQFLEKLEYEASPGVFAYFCRYYLYQRWKLYNHLHDALVDNPEGYKFNDSIVLDEKVKI